MDFIIIFSIQLILMIVGYLATILIGIRNKIEAIGVSYLFGSGFITILFLINHVLFKVNLGILNFLLVTSVSIIFLILTIFFKKKQDLYSSFSFLSIRKYISKLTCFEKLIISFLAIILSYTFLENYVWPITDWDALALYDFRAIVIAKRGNMLEGLELGYFFQYPPYTSFLHVFGYIFGVERIKIVYSFIYFSLITTFYSLLRRKRKIWISLLGTLMLAIDTFIFQHSTMAYTNLSYVVFLSLGLIYLAFWLTSSNRKDLVIGSIFVALSTWIRASDPFWYIGILIIIIGIIKNKNDLKIGASLITFSVGIYKMWDMFVKSLDITSLRNMDREGKYISVLLRDTSGYITILKSIPEITQYYWDNVSHVIGYLLPVLFFTVYYDFKRKNYLNKYLYLILFLSLLLIFIGIIIFSLFYDTWSQIGDSLQRLSMVLIPIIIFIIFNSSSWGKNVTEN